MKITITILITFISFVAMAQQTFPLYDGEIPGGKKTADEEEVNSSGHVGKISRPSITVFKSSTAKPNGAAVIIFPGGGYWINAIQHEGFDIAKRFNEAGITAFVVKYRIPNDKTMSNRETGPLQDAQQAIHIVRSRAREWGINPNQIGIMGFSAGGHLASTAGTHFIKAINPSLKNANLRPDFMILVYPVISFIDNVGHMGSREQLIGKSPSAEKIREYSNELQVTQDTPPTFLVHASDDDVVLSQNSILFYQSLTEHKVPAELHIYQKGGHGFGMNNPTTSDQWMERCLNWMQASGWGR
ncbi:MAG TPA: alpha/beta hydrolase [Chryseosolibacter sp.]